MTLVENSTQIFSKLGPTSSHSISAMVTHCVGGADVIAGFERIVGKDGTVSI